MFHTYEKMTFLRTIRIMCNLDVVLSVQYEKIEFGEYCFIHNPGLTKIFSEASPSHFHQFAN